MHALSANGESPSQLHLEPLVSYLGRVTQVNPDTSSTSFVIFATQRTGSSWLMDLLDSQPAIASYDELFLEGASGSGYWGRTDREFFEPFYTRRRRHDNALERARWGLHYLADLYAPRPRLQAIGMKLMYEQMWKNPVLWTYVVRHRVRVIHLTRRNLLDIVISEQTALARNRFHAVQGHAVETPVVTLDPAGVLAQLKTLELRIKIAHRLLATLPIIYHETTYETLVSDPSRVGDLIAFLGVDRDAMNGPPVSKFQKLNTAARSDLVHNFSELERVLSGTRFESFL